MRTRILWLHDIKPVLILQKFVCERNQQRLVAVVFFFLSGISIVFLVAVVWFYLDMNTQQGEGTSQEAQNASNIREPLSSTITQEVPTTVVNTGNTSNRQDVRTTTTTTRQVLEAPTTSVNTSFSGDDLRALTVISAMRETQSSGSAPSPSKSIK